MRVKTGAAALGLVAVLSVGLLACGEPGDVQVQAPLDRGPDALPDGITVSGEGEISGAPDTLSADLGVTVKRDNVGAAVADAGTAATAVIDAAEQAGVAEEDIQTRSYTVNQEFRYPEGGSPIPDGYRVTNTVILKIRTLDTAGAVIDATIAAGGDQVFLNGVAFTLEDDGPALAAAREQAFGDARSRAQQYADLSGQGLGRAQAVSDIDIVPQPMQFDATSARQAADSFASAAPIQGGQVTTKVTVQTRFSFG